MLSYQSYVPSPLPPAPPIDMTEDLIGLLIGADSKLAVLEKMATHIPDIDFIVSMYVRKEALMSLQIEGTQAALEDILDPMPEDNTNRSVMDVVNYIKAVEFAVKSVKASTPQPLDQKNTCCPYGRCQRTGKDPGAVSIFPELDWRSWQHTPECKIHSSVSR